MIKINDDLKIHFPLKLKPRKQQLEAFNFLKNSINTGMKFMITSVPTGVGKSYLALITMNWYRNFLNEDAKFDILTNSKILQKQYINDNPFIKNYEGRSNYVCDPLDTNCSAGYEICKSLGPKCGKECPYELAKSNWKISDVGLTNFHLFNTLAIYATNILTARESNVLIIDEAHEMEPVFTSYISVSLHAKQLKKYGFNLKSIEDYDKKITNTKSINSFVSYIKNTFLKDVEEQRDFLLNKIESNKKNKKLVKEYSKYSEFCNSQILKLKFLIEEYDKDKDNWTLDISKNKNDKMYSGIILEAKPVFGNKYMNEKIYKKYDHVIFMSATLEKEIFSYINGIDIKKTTYFNTPSPFNVNNRKIFYIKSGKMSYTAKKDTLKIQINYIKKILKKYNNKKGIIHTSNYEISNYIKDNIIDKRFIFHDSETRDIALEKHINSDYPSIIVSPSMGTGVDLIGDRSRFQIICKIPYPYLGSNNIKKRKEQYPAWYNYQTVSNLIQSCGRSVRSFDDYADTFILDSNFSDLLKYSGNYFPRWFTSSIISLKI